MRTNVQNMTSSRGNDIANQFIIMTEGITFFQSYSSVIAKRDEHGVITLDVNKWDYSKTTGKYRNQFLGETKKETQSKINSGEYRLEDLNN